VVVERVGGKVSQELKNVFRKKTTRGIYTLVNLIYGWADSNPYLAADRHVENGGR
jgi:hypothetical protein